MTLTITTTIEGPVDVSVSQLTQAFAGGAYTPEQVAEFAKSLIHWTDVFGFRTLLVASQIGHETGWFRFGNLVQPRQFNFAGLGATGPGFPGHSFDTIDEGVLAVVAHHAVYHWGPKENWPPHLRQYAGADPRYEAVLQAHPGVRIQVLGDYRGTWAVPGTTYPDKVAEASGRITQYPREEPDMASDIPGVPWVPANDRHFTKGRTVAWPERLIFHHTNGYDSLAWLTTSPNSDVSATYLMNRDGTVRAQLVRHADTPHTTGKMNPMSLTFEWERKWPEQRDIPDSTYDNLAAFAVKVIEAERKRGNPMFKGEPKRAWFGDHNDYYDTICPGNLDVGLIFARVVSLMRAPEQASDDEVELNGIRIYGGIFQAWKKAGGLSGPGLPITPEMDGSSRNATKIQWFERGVAEWRPGQWADNFDVTWGLVGSELYQRLLAEAA